MVEDPLTLTRPSQTTNVEFKLPIPQREYDYFKSWDLKRIRETWSCGATGYTKEDQVDIFNALQCFMRQDIVAGTDRTSGCYVVSEVYTTPPDGFPVVTSSASVHLVRPLRSSLLRHTFELALVDDAIPRCILWLCKKFDIAAPHLKTLVKRTDTNQATDTQQPAKLIRKLMTPMTLFLS